MTSYLTIARTAHGEVEVKSSRFRCTLQRVSSEEAARALVAALRKEHWDARHHCSAFVLGPDSALQRSSDDGEPAGTAGAPMLEVLRGAGVSDVAAVVTRWFGGTLRRDLVTEFAISLDHGSAGRVESELRARGLVVLDSAYGDRVRLVVGSTAPDSVGPLVAEVTAGAATAERVGDRWVDSIRGG